MHTIHPSDTAPDDKKRPAPRVDAVDLAILEALHHNANLSNDELAELVGLSPTAVSRRKSSLIDKGVILGMHARIDPRILKLDNVIYTLVSLKHHTGDLLGRLEAELAKHPNIVEWSRINGSWDVLLKFVVTDKEEHDNLYDKLLELDYVSRLRGMHLIGRPRGKPLPINVPDFPGRRELPAEKRDLKTQYAAQLGKRKLASQAARKKKDTS